MNWFYVDAGQQAGPVPDEQLDELVRNGRVRGDTLVWREGLPNWQPYAQARPEGLQPPPPAPPVAGAIPPMSAAPGQPMYSPDAGAYGMMYAGFWIRLVAKFIDGLIIGVIFGIPFAVFGLRSILAGVNSQSPNWTTFLAPGPWQLVYYIIMVVYSGFFVGKFGATPGKMALGLRVVSPEGTPIAYGRAFGRGGAEIISGLICNIGYLLAAFDTQKRALHDHIASTRVIRTRL